MLPKQLHLFSAKIVFGHVCATVFKLYDLVETVCHKFSTVEQLVLFEVKLTFFKSGFRSGKYQQRTANKINCGNNSKTSGHDADCNYT